MYRYNYLFKNQKILYDYFQISNFFKSTNKFQNQICNLVRIKGTEKKENQMKKKIEKSFCIYMSGAFCFVVVVIVEL